MTMNAHARLCALTWAGLVICVAHVIPSDKLERIGPFKFFSGPSLRLWASVAWLAIHQIHSLVIKFRERLRWRQLCGILWHGHFSLVAALGLTIVDIVVFVRVKQGAVEDTVVGVPTTSSSDGSGSGLAPLPVHSETVALVLGIFGLVMCLVTFFFLWLLPLRPFPKTTGPYRHVGTRSFTWTYAVDDVDVADDEVPRAIPCQLWYPAEEDNPYFSFARLWSSGARHSIAEQQGLTQVLNDISGFPKWANLYAHLGLVRTNSKWELPLSNHLARYPLVCFSHGHTGWRGQNTAMCEELASHGFIVVGVGHPGDALACVYPQLDNDGGDDVPWRTPGAYNMPPADLERGSASHKRYFGRILKERVTDVLYAVDVMVGRTGTSAASSSPNVRGTMTPKDAAPFPGRVDDSRIAVVGHSYGGGTAVLATMVDERLKTFVGLDAWVYPIPDSYVSLRSGGMFLSADGWEEGKLNEPRRRSLAGSALTAVALSLPDTNHHNFSDLTLLYSGGLMRMRSMVGASNRDEVYTLVRAMTLQYIQRRLDFVVDDMRPLRTTSLQSPDFDEDTPLII